MMRTDVVVVGGGPVGLTVAAELASQGVRTVVFERARSISARPKATTLHARAVQSLARRGMLPGLAPLPGTGEITRPFRYAGLPRLTITAPGGEPEPLLKIRQHELERALEARARAAGAIIARGHTVGAIDQGPDAVRVEAEGPDGVVGCVAGYLVGADGARGVVRTLAGIGARSWAAGASSLMAVVTLPDRRALVPGWHATERGWIVATALADEDVSLRTFHVPGAAEGREALTRRGTPTAEELRAEVSRIAGRDVPVGNPRWLSRFTDFARLADGYRHGRVLLAGDAAHSHFPIGGQGLTTGLLDAVNLGWKLALVARGCAPARLLDSYDPERRPAARRVIADTRTQVLLMRPDPDIAPLRSLLLGRLRDAGSNRVLGDALSAQATVLPPRCARPSPLEGRFLTNRRVGGGPADGDAARTEDSDVITLLQPGRPLLLLCGARAQRFRAEAAPWSALLSVRSMETDPDMPCEALLVRPDGYIAWASDGGPLTEAMTEWFGSPAAAATRV